MCIFSKYKNIIGEPGTGIHKYRLNDAAFVDYIVILASAIIISKKCNIPLVLTTILLFIVGEIFHYLFCVKTSTLKYLKIF